MSNSSYILAQIKEAAEKLPLPNAAEARKHLLNNRFQRRLSALHLHFDVHFREFTVLPECVSSEILHAAGHSEAAQGIMKVVRRVLGVLKKRHVISATLVPKLYQFVMDFPVYSGVVVTFLVHAAEANEPSLAIAERLEQFLRLFHATYIAARDSDQDMEMHTHGSDAKYSFCCLKQHQLWREVMSHYMR